MNFVTIERINPDEITRGNIVRVMIAGFSLVIFLLLAGGIIGVRNIRSIRQNAASLVREQRVTNRLVEELQHEQSTLSTVFYKLSRSPAVADYLQIAPELDKIDEDMERIASEASGNGNQALWLELNRASISFTEEARRQLMSADSPPLAPGQGPSSQELFRLQDQVISVIAKLIGSGYQRVLNAQSEIDSRSDRLMKETFLLLGASLLLAVVCSVLTVRLTAEMFRRMEWQAGELSRVSWNMLRDQESIARRFSHELHDELGQSLTAVKANLVSLNGTATAEIGRRGPWHARLQDCVRLVDEAVRNVRQLSQLLRPTILDDFGLDAGLRWLCEGFTQRTGIAVHFDSNLNSRLPDETETHLFRIAQEALTNVARHSGATEVQIDLISENHTIRLRISDNGKGLPEAPKTAPGVPSSPKSLGMVGMRARARAAGGELRVGPSKTGGLHIEVEVPVLEEHYEPHPHFIG